MLNSAGRIPVISANDANDALEDAATIVGVAVAVVAAIGVGSVPLGAGQKVSV